MSDGPALITVVLTLAGGLVAVSRDYTAADLDQGPPSWLRQPPRWLFDLRRSWPHPQAPILYEARVELGHDAEARMLLGLDP